MIDLIPPFIADQVAGLSPSAILCVGGGYVREDAKSRLFNQKKAISNQAILNPIKLAQVFVPESKSNMLGDGARVELLRRLFQSDTIRSAMPLLSAQRFRPQFYERLDSSLQQGRKLFAHAPEAEVLEARLAEILGQNDKRSEFFLLNHFWEKILTDQQHWDEPRLFESAAEACTMSEIHTKKIYRLEHFITSPRENYFWSELSKQVSVENLSAQHPAADRTQAEEKNNLTLAQAHSLEDAASFLFEEMVSEFRAGQSFKNIILVIQDIPVIRRTVKRMAEIYQIPFSDPRDPMALISSESIKSELLELEMVAKNFQASVVCQWLTLQPELKSHAGALRTVIQERGIQQGREKYEIESFKGGPSPEALLLLNEKLKLIAEQWPARLSLTQLAKKFSQAASFWQPFFESWLGDLRQVGVQERKRPLRYWFEQVQEKLKTARPVSDSLRVRDGLQLYRVDQAVNLCLRARDAKNELKVHFFGVSNDFFEAREWTNDWFTQREVEVLSSEFSLPSKSELQLQRENSFLSWAQLGTAKIWSYLYSESGAEQDSLLLTLSELPNLELKKLDDLGAHPRLSSSWSSDLMMQSERVDLPAALKVDKKYSISFLDDYSECPFVAYASHVLKAYDEREADYDLKGDSYGQLIHLALEKLVREKLSPDDAFEAAWSHSVKRGWFFSSRILSSIKHRALFILNEFQAQEVEYRARAQTETIAMEEDLKLDFVRDGYTFSGRTDRIDQHPDGLVVIDYKTQATLSNAQDILNKGKGLQLALYGLAARERLNQEVVAAQYIQLTNKEVKRNAGILFKKWNGSKVKNAITIAKSNNRAVLDLEPDVAWAELSKRVQEKLDQLKTADFSAKPVDAKDCLTCRYQLSCGFLRRNRTGENQEESSVD